MQGWHGTCELLRLLRPEEKLEVRWTERRCQKLKLMEQMPSSGWLATCSNASTGAMAAGSPAHGQSFMCSLGQKPLDGLEDIQFST